MQTSTIYAIKAFISEPLPTSMPQAISKSWPVRVRCVVPLVSGPATMTVGLKAVEADDFVTPDEAEGSNLSADEGDEVGYGDLPEGEEAATDPETVGAPLLGLSN